MEEVVTLVEVFNICTSILDFVEDDVDLPVDVVEILKTFGDGEEGNNDIEQTLVEIKNSLQYDEQYTALEEISSRLEVIDTRLDYGFTSISLGLSAIISAIYAYATWRFLQWIYNIVFI